MGRTEKSLCYDAATNIRAFLPKQGLESFFRDRTSVRKRENHRHAAGTRVASSAQERGSDSTHRAVSVALPQLLRPSACGSGVLPEVPGLDSDHPLPALYPLRPPLCLRSRTRPCLPSVRPTAARFSLRAGVGCVWHRKRLAPASPSEHPPLQIWAQYEGRKGTRRTHGASLLPRPGSGRRAGGGL